MVRKLFRLRSLVVAVAVAAIVAPAGHTMIGKPLSSDLPTADESGQALTPAECAALPDVQRMQISACLPGAPGVGVSTAGTTRTAARVGEPVSPALATAGESRPALTPEQCAALFLRTRTAACLQGEPGVGTSAVETTATQVRPARPLPLESLSLAQRTAAARPAPPVADGFDWLAAGIGGSVGMAALVLALAGAGVVRSRGLAHS